MEMWLKRSTLVLLTVTVAAMAISDQHPVMNENQTRVAILFGSSLHLNCSLTTVGYDRFRLAWYFNPNGSSFSDSVKLCDKMFNKSARNGEQEIEKKYALLNAKEKDSGWYFCQVTAEIPVFKLFNSTGTHVLIMKSMEHTTYPSLVTLEQVTLSPIDNIDWWMWITWGVPAFILIVLLVICVLLRKRPRRSRGQDPIYANTRRVASKQPSPRPGMPVENLKTASSSQNLRNPSPGRRSDDGKRKYKQ